jgi:cytochrome P450 / NADPH-cytochrome P450 reductase
MDWGEGRMHAHQPTTNLPIKNSPPPHTHTPTPTTPPKKGGNPPEVVEQAASVLGLGLDEVVKVTKASPEAASSSLVPGDVPLEVRTILTWCVELQHAAPRAQVAILVDRAACPPEKAALQDALAQYETEVLRNRRTLVELLAAHRSARLSLGELLTLLPPLKPRYYSISSSPRVAADRVSVSVGVVKGVTPTGRVHVGVCSNFLARREAGQPVRCFVKDTKSSFRLPAEGSTPIILSACLVGVG